MADSSRIFGLIPRKLLLGTTLGVALIFMLYQEYTKTIHFTNPSGVRATCSDCHVPDPWVYKVVRKVQASNELLHKALGSIDTPEKFNAKRLQLAKNVWHSMKETDSRECRNCHDFASMEPENQKKRSRKQHILGMQQGNTCIDCHKGIAHSKVHDQLTEEELTAMEQPRPQDKRPIPARWQAFIDGTDKEETKVAAVTETPVVEPEPVAKTMATDASSESQPLQARQRVVASTGHRSRRTKSRCFIPARPRWSGCSRAATTAASAPSSRAIAASTATKTRRSISAT
jgi:nitrate/TMAO reductase-like tetraheme cytochrome c subunit